MLAVIEGSKRGADGALVFLASAAPRFGRQAPDAFVTGSQGHISYVVSGLSGSLLSALWRDPILVGSPVKIVRRYRV